MTAELPEQTDAGEIGLFAALESTRAIRRYLPDPVPGADLAKILFAATRAPTGSNIQPFRFLVLRDGPVARQARRVMGDSYRARWAVQRSMYGYDKAPEGSRGARMGAVMQEFVDHFEQVPIIILVCSELEAGHVWIPTDGGSVYPAVQNLLLAARGLGYGGVVTAWHRFFEDRLRESLDIPPDVFIFATVTLGRPAGHHGPVRRLPLADVVFDDVWGSPAPWAVDPPGTRHSGFKPPPT